MSRAFTYCPRCATELVDVEIEGRRRRRCPDDACGFVHYDNPTPVVAAILQRDEDVILVRNKGWPEKWFFLVSGFLERGEDPAEGVLREVREEINADAELVEMVGVYAFPQMNQVIMAYHVRVEGEVSPGDEIAQIKAVPIAKLRPWPIGTGPAVADWLARQRAT